MLFNDDSEIQRFITYVNELIDQIEKSGDWRLTVEKIAAEITLINSYKKKHSNDNEKGSWGAVIDPILDETDEEIVLSVPVGNTIHLVEEYHVHAHPIKKRGYNYRDTPFITFRKPGGGVMDCVFNIEQKFPIEMVNWREYLDKLLLSVKKRL